MVWVGDVVVWVAFSVKGKYQIVLVPTIPITIG